MGDHQGLKNELKAHRIAMELTQAELASKVQVSRKTINTVENGVFIPSTILSLKLARALGVGVEDLFQLPD
ncbi:helix-turn-helix transcriptional regulator [Maricaulis sp.]|uniref:helix-turn-helix transcriptional regulator n=1 Tax=Maricaulis sp. TaxID=1486257 RepID=UPI002638959D|nr:helix-turn-helix transcriptional regulator [Maricaulis sp.]